MKGRNKYWSSYNFPFFPFPSLNIGTVGAKDIASVLSFHVTTGQNSNEHTTVLFVAITEHEGIPSSKGLQCKKKDLMDSDEQLGLGKPAETNNKCAD